MRNETHRSNRMLARLLGLALCAATLAGPIPGRATVGSHLASETPGSNEAVIFAPVGARDVADSFAFDYFTRVLRAQNYNITRYVDEFEATDDIPQGATAGNFKKLSGKGVILISTVDSLLVEWYKTEAWRNVAFVRYLLPSIDFSTVPPSAVSPAFAQGELVTCDHLDIHEPAPRPTRFGICITPAGIRAHFRDKDSIVFVGSCGSAALSDDFNARQFFGYKGAVTCTPINSDVMDIFGRMHGEKLNGTKRSAIVAYQAGHSANLEEIPRLPRIWDLVLSPAVESHKPLNEETLQLGRLYRGYVHFDTRMDRSSPATVLSLTNIGCNPVILNPQWPDDFTLTFGLVVTGPGSATIHVLHGQAHAGRDFKNNLDGNNDAPGSPPHIGPNRDNFAWKINCPMH